MATATLLESTRILRTISENVVEPLIPPPKQKLSKKDVALATVSMISILVCCMIFSMQVPFFPHEAKRKGLSALELSIVFGIYELSIFFTSLFASKVLKVVGKKATVVRGIAMEGLSCIVFGCLTFVDNKVGFLVGCLITRVIEAIGQCVTFIGVLNILMQQFPRYIPFVAAWSNTFFGVGMIMGPFFGEIIFDAVGYVWTFSLVGLLLLVLVPLAMFIYPKDIKIMDPHKSSDKNMVLPLLSIPGTCLALFAVAVSMICSGFVQVSLAYNIARFGLKRMSLGLLFVVSGISYAIANPLWGWLVGLGLLPEICMAIGALFVGLGFLFIDPVPLFPLPPELALAILGLAMIGTGFAATHTPSLVYMKRIAHDCLGYEDDEVISGMWNSAFSLGGFIGPLAGGLLLGYGFRLATLVLVIANWVVTILFFISAIVQKCKKLNLNKSGYIRIGD